MTDADMALRERIMGELLACYGEGENTDWPYLNDLCELIASIVERERAGLSNIQGDGIDRQKGT